MVIKLDGQLSETYPNYCTCSMSAYVKTKVINDVTDENRERTASPSESLSASPSVSLSAPPSVSLSAPPSESPSLPDMKPKFNPLLARIKSISDDFPDITGVVHIDKDKIRGNLIINYDIRTGPEMCNDCVIGIYNGGNCRTLYSTPFYDPDETDNPWTVDGGASIVTNMSGDAAAYIEVYNGRPLKKHACKYAVFHDSSGTPISCGLLIPVGENRAFCNKE
eukprot:CAMPEP_0203651620 /NCGR_PEP_ID=MMETSP0088-20131115/27927_1 /ASSEMBLY_ACC=CAM_ASM_001087 /TAXON_ID=426623 /ORGANISM="Chaetoceros affinis, Strain CCMP159" /LENGTH=221 /DNA_ID=CAMNT_0050510829 /DNA_START=110 /DNA_END=775 /DNA_ORIENTATION=-